MTRTTWSTGQTPTTRFQKTVRVMGSPEALEHTRIPAYGLQCPRRSSIEWTEATWNPTTGCDCVSDGCDNCLAPETLILYADMTRRPIGSARVGDVLVGFTAEPGVGRNRVLDQSVVQHVWTREGPTVELEVGRRRAIASEDHKWLAQVGPSWCKTSWLHLGPRLRLQGRSVSVAQLRNR
ncbi:DUF5131 family protein [Streptomyces sp. NPDC054863]